jgi:ATP-dependent exoDNAse (exonuclease V) beta subunit
VQLAAAANETWPAIADELLSRRATFSRKTKETEINIELDLDAEGPISIATGHGFFDHMLEQLAKHGGFALTLSSRGDLHIDEHHTVEDCALALGSALKLALGDKRGIARIRPCRPWTRRAYRWPSIPGSTLCRVRGQVSAH